MHGSDQLRIRCYPHLPERPSPLDHEGANGCEQPRIRHARAVSRSRGSCHFAPFVVQTFAPFVVQTFAPFVVQTFAPFVVQTFAPFVIQTFAPFADRHASSRVESTRWARSASQSAKCSSALSRSMLLISLIRSSR